MSDTLDISTGLRNIMKSQKLTIAQLAELSNIPEDTIKSIRSGKTKNPGIQTLISLANAMHCSIDELVGRDLSNSEEAEFISSWRKLNNHGKKLIQAIADIEDSDKQQIIL